MERTMKRLSLGHIGSALAAIALLQALPHMAYGQVPSATVGAKPATAFSSNVATEWFNLDLQLVQQTPGFSPPVASRALAYLGLTLYESVQSGIPSGTSLAGQLNELQSLPLI
jgi:hypothetical protein